MAAAAPADCGKCQRKALTRPKSRRHQHAKEGRDELVAPNTVLNCGGEHGVEAAPHPAPPGEAARARETSRGEVHQAHGGPGRPRECYAPLLM